MRWLLVAAVLATLLADPISAGTSATLRLDGATFHPELAVTEVARSRGLMNRKQAPADGMLFVFPHATDGGFWMKDTLVPLTVVFFDSAGARVRKLAMTPCRSDPCPVYVPGRAYRFALELRSTDSRTGRRLGPPSALRSLVGRAS